MLGLRESLPDGGRSLAPLAYSRWVSELREELQTTCISVEHFRVVLEQVSYYLGIAEEIETSRAIIARMERDAPRGKFPESSENQD